MYMYGAKEKDTTRSAYLQTQSIQHMAGGLSTSSTAAVAIWPASVARSWYKRCIANLQLARREFESTSRQMREI